jgi:hypothetical protein
LLAPDPVLSGLSSDQFVAALERAGFIVFKKTPDATILERGARAVVVPTRERMADDLIIDLRRMSGLSWTDLERHGG